MQTFYFSLFAPSLFPPSPFYPRTLTFHPIPHLSWHNVMEIMISGPLNCRLSHAERQHPNTRHIERAAPPLPRASLLSRSRQPEIHFFFGFAIDYFFLLLAPHYIELFVPSILHNIVSIKNRKVQVVWIIEKKFTFKFNVNDISNIRHNANRKTLHSEKVTKQSIAFVPCVSWTN